MSKFTPSAAEVALVNQIFVQTDSQKLGVVTGEAAVKIFSGSKLPPATLAEIWNLADEDNNGVLTRKGVAIAIRLLGHAQRGERVTEALVHKQGVPPSIEGLNAPVSHALSPQNTGVRSTKSPPPGIPPLTPQDKTKFLKLFAGCGPVGGLLSGDKARDVFVKSKLPVDKLSQIWNLADTKNRGALDVTDFTIAMYLIQAAMSGTLQIIPAVLPPYVHDQAKPESILTHATGESASGSLSPSSYSGFNSRPISTIQPHYTGQSPIQPQITGPALRPNVTGTAPTLPARTFGSTPAFPFSPQATAPKWDVTPEEKANADKIFDSLDKGKRGFIEGDVAVPFLVQSKLSDDILAQVWDLSDINKEGTLTKDGFAIALHLIQGKLAGKDIPSVLPPSLIPPSKRTNGVTASPPQPAIPEAMRDLMWDDTPAVAPAPASTTPQQPPPPMPHLRPQGTGTLSPQHTATGFQPRQSVFATNDPFASSPFGAPAPAPAIHRDLLGDDDEPAAPSHPFEDKSAEIGNLQNQLNSTNRSLETTKTDRATVERQVTEQAAQLAALQTQLSSAKAAYETETRLLGTLRDRFSTQAAEISKVREELVRAESDLSGLRVEKAELEGGVLRDKEEIRELQRKMTEVGMTVETFKADIEKGKKEAKQQKGLLAIARKQLATREAEKAKVEKELEETQAEMVSTTKEREEAESELAYDLPTTTSSSELIFAAAQPLPISPEMTGTPNSAKSTNPFERLAQSSSPPPPSQSPFLPFATTSAVPTPTQPAVEEEPAPAPVPVLAVPAPAQEEDPFGFSDAFEDSAPTAKPRPEDLLSPSRSVMSPTDTDMFATPLSSAGLVAGSSTDPAEEAASHFPALDAVTSDVVSPQLPGHFPTERKPTEDDAGLDSQLKEIEQDESDSDEDDDEPLTAVKAKLAEKVEPEASSAPAPTTNGATEPALSASASSAFDDSFGISTLPSNATIRPATPQRSILAASIASDSPAPSSISKDAFGSPFGAPAAKEETPLKIETPPMKTTDLAASASSPPADVAAFDEALGGKLASSSSAPSNFTFDSAFDDNFDFAAASAASASTSEHPAASGAPAPNGTSSSSQIIDNSAFPLPRSVSGSARPAREGTEDSFDAVFLSSGGPSAPSAGPATEIVPPVIQAQESRPFSFDDAFSIPNQSSSQAAAASATAATAVFPPPLTKPSTSTSSMGVSGISFDDAFGGVSASEALALDNSFTASGLTPATAVPSQFQPPAGPPPSHAPSAFSQTAWPSTAATSTKPADAQSQTQTVTTTSPPTSPTRDSSSSHFRSSSPQPPRSMSPIPRLSSPKQRPGTANSVEKEKTRHSKLSIRLPFGRKKKSGTDAPPMPPPLAQTSVIEDPTPAAEDDIEAVKQLCQMGFSRGQAVTALEKYGYDVQRALNSLLGGA